MAENSIVSKVISIKNLKTLKYIFSTEYQFFYQFICDKFSSKDQTIFKKEESRKKRDIKNS